MLGKPSVAGLVVPRAVWRRTRADQPVLPPSNRSTELKLSLTTCLRSYEKSTRRRERAVCKVAREACTKQAMERTRLKVDKIRTRGTT